MAGIGNNMNISNEMYQSLMKDDYTKHLVKKALADGKIDGSDDDAVAELNKHLTEAAKADGTISEDEQALIDALDFHGLLGTNKKVVEGNLKEIQKVHQAAPNQMEFKEVNITTQNWVGSKTGRVLSLRSELDEKKDPTLETALQNAGDKPATDPAGSTGGGIIGAIGSAVSSAAAAIASGAAKMATLGNEQTVVNQAVSVADKTSLSDSQKANIKKTAQDNFYMPESVSDINSQVGSGNRWAASDIEYAYTDVKKIVDYIKANKDLYKDVNIKDIETALAEVGSVKDGVFTLKNPPAGVKHLESLNSIYHELKAVQTKAGLGPDFAGPEGALGKTVEAIIKKDGKAANDPAVQLAQKAPGLIQNAELLKTLMAPENKELLQAVLAGDNAKAQEFLQQYDAKYGFHIDWGSLSSTMFSFGGMIPALAAPALGIGMATSYMANQGTTGILGDFTLKGFGPSTGISASTAAPLPGEQMKLAGVNASDVAALIEMLKNNPDAMQMLTANAPEGQMVNDVSGMLANSPHGEKLKGIVAAQGDLSEVLADSGSYLQTARTSVEEAAGKRANAEASLQLAATTIEQALKDPDLSPEAKTYLLDQQKAVKTAIDQLKRGDTIATEPALDNSLFKIAAESRQGKLTTSMTAAVVKHANMKPRVDSLNPLLDKLATSLDNNELEAMIAKLPNDEPDKLQDKMKEIFLKQIPLEGGGSTSAGKVYISQMKAALASGKLDPKFDPMLKGYLQSLSGMLDKSASGADAAAMAEYVKSENPGGSIKGTNLDLINDMSRLQGYMADLGANFGAGDIEQATAEFFAEAEDTLKKLQGSDGKPVDRAAIYQELDSKYQAVKDRGLERIFNEYLWGEYDYDYGSSQPVSDSTSVPQDSGDLFGAPTDASSVPASAPVSGTPTVSAPAGSTGTPAPVSTAPVAGAPTGIDLAAIRKDPTVNQAMTGAMKTAADRLKADNVLGAAVTPDQLLELASASTPDQLRSIMTRIGVTDPEGQKKVLEAISTSMRTASQELTRSGRASTPDGTKALRELGKMADAFATKASALSTVTTTVYRASGLQATTSSDMATNSRLAMISATGLNASTDPQAGRIFNDVFLSDNHDGNTVDQGRTAARLKANMNMSQDVFETKVNQARARLTPPLPKLEGDELRSAYIRFKAGATQSAASFLSTHGNPNQRENAHILSTFTSAHLTGKLAVSPEDMEALRIAFNDREHPENFKQIAGEILARSYPNPIVDGTETTVTSLASLCGLPSPPNAPLRTPVSDASNSFSATSVQVADQTPASQLTSRLAQMTTQQNGVLQGGAATIQTLLTNGQIKPEDVTVSTDATGATTFSVKMPDNSMQNLRFEPDVATNAPALVAPASASTVNPVATNDPSIPETPSTALKNELTAAFTGGTLSTEEQRIYDMLKHEPPLLRDSDITMTTAADGTKSFQVMLPEGPPASLSFRPASDAVIEDLTTSTSQASVATVQEYNAAPPAVQEMVNRDIAPLHDSNIATVTRYAEEARANFEEYRAAMEQIAAADAIINQSMANLNQIFAQNPDARNDVDNALVDMGLSPKAKAQIEKADDTERSKSLTPMPPISGDQAFAQWLEGTLKIIRTWDEATRKLILAQIAKQMMDQIINQFYKKKSDESSDYHDKKLGEMQAAGKARAATVQAGAQLGKAEGAQAVAALSGDSKAGARGEAFNIAALRKSGVDGIRQQVAARIQEARNGKPPINITSLQEQQVMGMLNKIIAAGGSEEISDDRESVKGMRTDLVGMAPGMKPVS